MPDSGPRLIGPAETEGKFWLARFEHLVEGALQDSSSREPVVPVAERLDAVGLGHFGLGGTGLGHAEIVEAEVGWDVRLVVTRKHGHGLSHVGPLGEASSPPLVVFRNGVKLGKVERDETRSVLRARATRWQWAKTSHDPRSPVRWVVPKIDPLICFGHEKPPAG